ncbi:MAG TPA: endonuclease/exonuclease/phosphatase family protein [Polyangiaceae bacterium]|nr:endonuclease/exonuclease/phosphatase family protein [Polyangiaceae bacterium]
MTNEGRAATLLRRGVLLASALYPVALVFVVLVLRYIGERFWLLGAIGYLPRLGFGLPLPVLVVALLVLRSWRLLALQLVSLLLLVFPVMGFVIPSSPSAGPGPVLRIMSYNINSALGGGEQIAQEIEALSPDVVVMQEIGKSGDYFAERLRARYPNIRVSTQFFLGSRYPITPGPEPDHVSLYGTPRSPRFTEQVLDTPLGKIALYNVHPISPREGLSAIRGRGLRREIASGRLLAGVNAPVLRANNLLRDLQVTSIATLAARETVPVVIAGDTNLPGLSATFRRHLSDYQDGFTEAGGGFGYTFPTNHHPWMRIDRILASHSLRFVHFEVGSSRVSDHRYVFAELTRAAE